MKATRSKDGVYRFTLRLPFRVGRRMLIAAAEIAAGHYGDPMPKTRTAALALVRKALDAHGWGAELIGMDCGAKDSSVETAAGECITALFPELCQEKGGVA